MLPDDQGRFGASLDVTIDLPLAGAASRGLARMVDLLLLSLVQLVLGVMLGFVIGLAFGIGWATRDATTIGIAVGVWLLLVFLIQWFFLTALELYTRGQTPGKRLLGLRVVRDDGGALTLVPALLRNLLRLDTIPGGGAIDLALMLWGDKSQRLGDIAAGTLVVDEGRPAPTRTWPPALSAAEVALLGVWFARAPDLEAHRRGAIARRLVARLAAAHPDLLDAGLANADGSAVATLERLAPVTPAAA